MFWSAAGLRRIDEIPRLQIYFTLHNLASALHQNTRAVRSRMTVQYQSAVWTTDAEANLIILNNDTHRLFNYSLSSESVSRLRQQSCTAACYHEHVHAVKTQLNKSENWENYFQKCTMSRSRIGCRLPVSLENEKLWKCIFVDYGRKYVFVMTYPHFFMCICQEAL